MGLSYTGISCLLIDIVKGYNLVTAPPESINLKTMQHLFDAFKVPVGLSDHTLGNNVPIASVAMGATIIEKHFVMSKEDDTADSFFSMTPGELKQLVTGVRQVEAAVGKVNYPTEPSKARRCLFAARDIAEGEAFTRENVVNLRPGVGELMPKDLAFIVGRAAVKSIAKGEPLSWLDVGAVK